MRSGRLLIGLWGGATVLVDAVALSVALGRDAVGPPAWPHPAVLVLFALAMSQVSLVAIWAGFGGRSLGWRAVGLAAAAAWWARHVAWVVAPSQIDAYACLFGSLLLGQSIGVLVPLTVARLAGARLTGSDRMDPAEGDAPRTSRFQFSLREMLSWTTILAIVMSALRYSVDEQIFPRYLGDWRQLIVLSLANALPALAALWAALGTKRPVLRAVAMALATAAAIGGGGTLAEVVSPRAYAAMCVLQFGCVLASLGVFRVAGYRVVRGAGHPAVSASQAACGSGDHACEP